MSEKRFKTKDVRTECFIIEDTNGNEIIELAEFKSYAQCKLVCDLLNEQQSTITELKSIINFASNEGDLIVLLMKEIIKLRQQLQEKQEDEKLYANEILELNKTKKEMLNFKQLGGDY